MQVDMGTEPSKEEKIGIFTVQANIYSESANDYIAHWDGGVFNNYDDALNYWDDWALCANEVDEIMHQRRLDGDHSHHELEIGIYSNSLCDLPLMNLELDVSNEW